MALEAWLEATFNAQMAPLPAKQLLTRAAFAFSLAAQHKGALGGAWAHMQGEGETRGQCQASADCINGVLFQIKLGANCRQPANIISRHQTLRIFQSGK